MKRPIKCWQLLLTVLLSGCIPMNVTDQYRIIVLQDHRVAVVCDNKAVMDLKVYALPDKKKLVELIDRSTSDEETIELLLDHIEELRNDLSDISSTDYQCRTL